MLPILRHIVNVLRHKWFVMVAGRQMNVPWRRLLRHDLSKFSWVEIRGYAKRFHSKSYDFEDIDPFERAWAHHVAKNDHHPEHWGGRPMPEIAIREMVADWMGASRGYEGRWPRRKSWTWYHENFPKLKLHPLTRLRAQTLIRMIVPK